MDTVNRMMRSNDVRVTKKVIEQKGALYDATVYKASIAKEESYFPLKLGDERLKNVTKYGGYTSIKLAYYTIVSYDEIASKRSEHIIRMVPIPIYISKLANNFEDIENYARSFVTNKSKKSIDNFKVVYRKLFINSLIKLNGFKYYVGGKTDDSFYIDSGTSLILDEETNKLFGKLVKYCNSDFKRKEDEYINIKNNLELYNILVLKKESSYYENKKLNKLEEFKKQVTIDKYKNLSLEDQCSVLLEILNTLTDKNSTYDLKKIGISVYRAKTSMKLNSYTSFKVINQSITGLFENEIDILG